METEIEYYLELLAGMKRTHTNGFVSPHKPVLLLAIQYMVVMGWITDNHIVLDKALEGYFKQYWRLKVDNGSSQLLMVAEDLCLQAESKYPFRCKIEYPFYHLSSEPFWNLVKSDQWEYRPNYSLGQLKRFYQYAEIDQKLVDLMKEAPTGRKIRDLLEGMI